MSKVQPSVCSSPQEAQRKREESEGPVWGEVGLRRQRLQGASAPRTAIAAGGVPVLAGLGGKRLSCRG